MGANENVLCNTYYIALEFGWNFHWLSGPGWIEQSHYNSDNVKVFMVVYKAIPK